MQKHLPKSCSAVLWSVLVALPLTACSLKQESGTRVHLVVPAVARSAERLSANGPGFSSRGLNLQTGLPWYIPSDSTPGAWRNFSCLGVSVRGSGIARTEGLAKHVECTVKPTDTARQLGQVAGLVSSDGSADLNLSIAQGSERTFSLFGLKTETGSCFDLLKVLADEAIGIDTSVKAGEPFLLASKTVDIGATSVSVELHPVWTVQTAKRMFCDELLAPELGDFVRAAGDGNVGSLSGWTPPEATQVWLYATPNGGNSDQGCAEDAQKIGYLKAADFRSQSGADLQTSTGALAASGTIWNSASLSQRTIFAQAVVTDASGKVLQSSSCNHFWDFNQSDTSSTPTHFARFTNINGAITSTDYAQGFTVHGNSSSANAAVTISLTASSDATKLVSANGMTDDYGDFDVTLPLSGSGIPNGQAMLAGSVVGGPDGTISISGMTLQVDSVHSGWIQWYPNLADNYGFQILGSNNSTVNSSIRCSNAGVARVERLDGSNWVPTGVGFACAAGSSGNEFLPGLLPAANNAGYVLSFASVPSTILPDTQLGLRIALYSRVADLDPIGVSTTQYATVARSATHTISLPLGSSSFPVKVSPSRFYGGFTGKCSTLSGPMGLYYKPPGGSFTQITSASIYCTNGYFNVPTEVTLPSPATIGGVFAIAYPGSPLQYPVELPWAFQ